MKSIIQLIIIFAFQSLFNLAYSAPAQVVIIRHGEKPEVGNELSAQGWLRANALPQFFENNKIIQEYGRPIALYAGSPNKPDGAIRSIQTITPYANFLGLSLHKEIRKKEFSILVNKIMNTKEYDGHTVIICWEHSVIPDMAQLFGATNAPNSWDDNIFDRAWVIRFSETGVTSFLNLAQHLLPSDSAE